MPDAFLLSEKCRKESKLKLDLVRVAGRMLSFKTKK